MMTPQLSDIYNKIMNRDEFKYDLNSDMLYQQYKDQYVNMGQMAMKDTMGQAAALTGGYGSSYAQSVGQQQYDTYLKKLNEVVSELYGMAQDQYNTEGQRMLDQYSVTADRESDEYGKYRDEMSDYRQNVDYLSGQADNAYDRGYENWYNSYQMGLNAENMAYNRQQDADNTAYNRQQDAYGNLVSLISSTGYIPTAEELSAAGMSQAQAQAYANYYAQANGLTASGGGFDGGSNTGENTDSYDSETADTQQMLVDAGYNIAVDGIWGPKTQEAYDDYTNGGGEDAEIADAALTYFNANPGIALDSRTLDMWLSNNGYSGADAQLFKVYMEQYGAKYSR